MTNTYNTFEDYIRLKRTNAECFYSLPTQRTLYLNQKNNPEFFKSFNQSLEDETWI